MKDVRAVLFDLDGTLADTPRAIAAALHQVLAERGVQAEESVVRAWVGRPLEEALASLLALAPGDAGVAEAAADYQRLFRAHLLEATTPLGYPGVVEGLAQLRATGLELAVVTAKPRRPALRMLQMMEVAADFAVVVGDDSVDESKPHPAAALLAAEQLDVAPRFCVVVGDGTADIAMARAAGMRALGVEYGVASADQLREAGAYAVATDFETVTAELLAANETAPL